MATTGPAVPPLDKMFLIGIWIETALYGISCVVFSTALYVLLHKRSSQTRPLFLLLVSCSLFALATAHVGLVLRQLLEAFIYSPPGTATLYFADQSAPIPVAKLVLYSVNVFTQDMVLVWRLWIVWGRNWRIVIVPIILECMHTAAAFIAEARGAIPGIPVFDKILHRWALVNWSLDLTVNIGVTAGIAYKLWSVGMTIQSLTGRNSNKYYGAILTVIESGGLFTTATLVTFSLYLSGQIATVMAIDSVMQLAVLTPLLIIVRVGLGITHGSNTTAYASTAAATSTLPHAVSNSLASRQVRIDIQKSTTSNSTYEMGKMQDGGKF
ncbi:hypothetical protein DFH07DRAFT_842219 [Mycena maculata]|uniref:Uncharacterized protein n=1 Tax=Mycena maculata TaxID=230809 RepID=A0AAD7IAG0_9AGAR|nr:hypothetical protein DFH07DRAFT_842219 [Mycena maculata]